MKRKKLIIFAICIILLVGGLICLNRSFEPIHEKSDDGKWKVCYSKSWFNDLWSGYLFYTGNSSGDAGTIEIKIDTGLTDSDNDDDDDDDEWEPEEYYKNANWDELLACGLQRKMTYFFYDLGDRPKNTTITVNWQKDGKKKTSVIKVE